jgi:hypothetical protein
MLAGLALVLSLAGTAAAHGMRTAYVEIDEAGPGRLTVRFRVTAPAAGVEPRISGCTLTAVGGVTADDTGLLRTFAAACEGPLAAQSIAVSGLGATITEAVVWIAPHGGAARSKLLSRAEPEWRLSEGEPSRALDVARAYVRLGIEHIAGGVDHLLFLFLLLLTARGLGAALLAETAFSISHAVSFTATALGWLRVSAPAAEAGIALSLVLMALEVERKDRSLPSARHTAGLALIFGAVHGLGFAGGMTAVGVPERHAASALLGFGAGVELGQVVFVIAAFALLHLARQSPRYRLGALATAYAGGALATCWFLQRLVVLFPISMWRM